MASDDTAISVRNLTKTYLLFVHPDNRIKQAVPAALRPFFTYNPLGSVIEALRATLTGIAINCASWSAALASALVACLLGYVLPARPRRVRRRAVMRSLKAHPMPEQRAEPSHCFLDA